MGSACRCTTFHSPSSGLKIIVTLRANGVSLIASAHLCLDPLYPHDVGELGGHLLRDDLEPEISPSRMVDAACSMVFATSSHSARRRAQGVGEGHVVLA